MGNEILILGQTPKTSVARRKPTLWPALVIALGLHSLILLLPLSRTAQNTDPAYAKIELQLTTYEPEQVNEEIFIPDNRAVLGPATRIAPGPTDPEPELLPLVKAPAEAQLAGLLSTIERDLENMNATEKARLTSTVLSSQFITEESVADQLFGQPLEPGSTSTQKEFHYPARPNLVAMLDQPMQELPFEYTPGLVKFAYVPGIRGDLQRFGDKITPEFSWITQYGTQFKCTWILVIVACGWGRP